MRSLGAAIMVFILIFAFCLWSACRVDQTIGALSKAINGTTDNGTADVLVTKWEKNHAFLAFMVNRALLDKCERALLQMKSYKTDDPLFAQARCEFESTLSVIQKSYGLHFGAVL